ncbi:MAG: leucine-rich repeat domain-containing protein [Alphaproteobacteria bacterium]|nr:leucine-rich repeat domain-containing protein [Alphaproteobacteria bacterium]
MNKFAEGYMEFSKFIRKNKPAVIASFVFILIMIGGLCCSSDVQYKLNWAHDKFTQRGYLTDNPSKRIYVSESTYEKAFAEDLFNKVSIDIDGSKLTEEQLVELLRKFNPKKLRILRIQRCAMTDKSLELLQTFKKLTELTLRGNSIIRLPKSIFSLQNLRRLDVGLNNLRELQSDIGKLSLLQYLDVRANKLCELPKEIGCLANLDRLYIQYNSELSSLPEEIGNCKSLVRFCATGCNLKTLPRKICELKNLEYLEVAGNDLRNLPKEIKNFLKKNSGC